MSVEVCRLSYDDTMRHMSGFIELLRDAVDHEASVGFLAPMDLKVAEDYWLSIADDVKKGTTTIFGAVEDGRLVGTVQLVAAWKPNSPHRADVSKLLVHSDCHRRGIATQLMSALEQTALENGRWLLVLDTELNSGAETLYTRLGFTRLGEIPEYVLSNRGDGYLATVYYYKRLDH